MGKKKTFIGDVVSNSMDKTRLVSVERIFSHQKYKKIMKQVRKLNVHDEKNECRIGDKVRIAETRPLSKNKRWRVVEIIGRSGLEAPDTATKEA